MNRIYKFRAWDKNNKLMLTWANLLNHETFDVLVNNNYQIMQYTGLKSKSGIEIYEGDIYAWIDLDGHLRVEEPYIVKYKSEMVMHEASWTGYDLHPDMLDEIEVIGNIWENPDLLEANLTEE